MVTAARPFSSSSAGWYTSSGELVFEIIGKTTGKPRPVNITDARRLGYLPRVMRVLQILARPELENYKIESAVLSVLTTPRLPGEADDAFVHRVLHVEKVQDQERDTAADRGRLFHDAIEHYLLGEGMAEDLKPWLLPAIEKIMHYGTERVSVEKVLVGADYAGRTDLIQETADAWWIWDWKTTRTLPEKRAYDTHVIQAAAYAGAYWRLLSNAGPELTRKPIRTGNCYISTIDQGKFIIHEHAQDWQRVYQTVWLPLLSIWRYLKSF